MTAETGAASLGGIAVAVARMGALLDTVAGEPGPVDALAAHAREADAKEAEALGRVIAEVTSLRSRLDELRLRLLRLADETGAARASAASGTDAWLARLTGSSRAVMAGGLRLARLLEERYPAVREAFAVGDLSEAQARVIVSAAERMPAEVPDDRRAEAVAGLVERAVRDRLDPGRLRRVARRMGEAVSRQLADRHQAALLADEEARAAAETWLVLDDRGDGTVAGRFVVPELHGHLLRAHLEHLSAPRRSGRNARGDRVVDPTVADFTGAHAGLSRSESLGHAFTELLEHLPTDGLANHGRVGASVMIHLDHSHLLDGLAAARIDVGAEISAGEARRLACSAGLIPAVLGGSSVPLDLGREARLHSKAQRAALSARHDGCAAEGCQRPFAWCEIHHPHAWSAGGRTDLRNALPLCGWHHRRVHDPAYDHVVTATGEIRYRQRRARAAPAQARAA